MVISLIKKIIWKKIFHYVTLLYSRLNFSYKVLQYIYKNYCCVKCKTKNISLDKNRTRISTILFSYQICSSSNVYDLGAQT